ncbi:MAG: DUF3299 domain-containing protein [Saprospiraceae bacterium]|nr:DUF3299 domain-containing protein [Saprospiraceae bacterium]
MKIFIFVFICSVFAISGKAENLPFQSKDMWQTLGLVTFISQYDPEFMMEIKIPKVSPLVEKLDGKEIEIEGYMIPLTGQTQQSHFMLSRYPQSTCFFCGKAGPESAMQVFMKNNVKVPISERKVKVKGKLMINPKDITSLLYTMEDGVLID